MLSKATSFMGNMNYFKTIKGSLWGGDKGDKSDRSGYDKKGKAQTMRIPKILA